MFHVISQSKQYTTNKAKQTSNPCNLWVISILLWCGVWWHGIGPSWGCLEKGEWRGWQSSGLCQDLNLMGKLQHQLQYEIRNYWLIWHTREIYGEIYIRQLGTMIRDLLLDKSPLLCWIEWDDLIPSFIQLHIISFYQANLDFSLHSLKEVLQF